MNILVIGQNGREHALAVAYAKSKKVQKVVMTPGNGLTDFAPSTGSGQGKIKNYPDVGMMNFDGIVEVCKKEKIDLVDVAQDDIIAAGFVDKLQKLGKTAFGPTQKASQLEWDKEWARNFMVKYNLPSPPFEAFTSQQKAIDYIQSKPDQLFFVKATGLALGKGVIKATNREQAFEAIRQMSQFGKSGEKFLIEEGLVGEEFSLFAICDGETFIVTKSAQDHKTVFNADAGPNTGGVGSVAPTGVITPKIQKEIEEKILKPVLAGMKKEGRIYKGIFYLGGMVTREGHVKIIEFNARWGDPEAEVIVPSIQTDYVDIVQAVIKQTLSETKIVFDKKIRVSVAGCARGYPWDYSEVKGKEVFGVVDASKLPGITVYGSGIKREGNRFFVNGGRVFYVVAEGDTIIQARVRAYGAMAMISIDGNNLHFRTDIGWRDVARVMR